MVLQEVLYLHFFSTCLWEKFSLADLPTLPMCVCVKEGENAAEIHHFWWEEEGPFPKGLVCVCVVRESELCVEKVDLGRGHSDRNSTLK